MLFVQAGGDIDLGTTKGIQSVGNFYYDPLGQKGSSLVVVSGSPKEMGEDDIRLFFHDLKETGVEYSALLSQGKKSLALAEVEKARREIIEPFFADSSQGSGDINMIRSTINSTCSNDDIFVIAKGTMNVGQSTATTEKQKQSTGIFTAAGGSINVFANLYNKENPKDEINVNEARVMTFRGGDILVWSNYGNINAGRGSKAAISVNPPQKIPGEKGYVVAFTPPAVGSGIRTLTYDPDGEKGPLTAPPQGDVYLFAPAGEIDAGEAGVAGKNVILGAVSVVNMQNISFSQTSVGIPESSGGAGSLAALSGSSSLTETTKEIEKIAKVNASSQSDSVNQSISEIMETLRLKWPDVEVIGFDEEEKDKKDIEKNRGEEGKYEEKDNKDND